MDHDARLFFGAMSNLPDIKRLNIDTKKDIADLCTDAIGDVIPFIPLVKSSLYAYANYKERKFAKKCIVFLSTLSEEDIDQKEIDEFVDELYKHTQENGYDTIVGMIDRFDNENKAVILSNLVRHCAEKQFTVPEFLRVVNALERVPYSDLKYLFKYSNDYYEAGESEILATCGLIIQTNLSTGVWDNGDDEGIKYGLSRVGENMLRFGFESSEFKYQGEGLVINPATIPDTVIESIVNGTFNENQRAKS